MASNIKKYILTSITLGLIAASGALLIAGTNMITRDPIAENELKRINKGIVTIFGENISFEQCDLPVLPQNEKYQYVNTCYEIKDNNELITGYAFRTDGKNDYGKISLLIGFDNNVNYEGLSIIVNEQSFASDLKKGYINPIADGSKTIDDVDIHCGATFGARLVRDMVNEAQKIAGIKVGENND